LPSINLRSHKVASSRNGADSERRYQVSHVRFQQTSNDDMIILEISRCNAARFVAMPLIIPALLWHPLVRAPGRRTL